MARCQRGLPVVRLTASMVPVGISPGAKLVVLKLHGTPIPGDEP